VTLAAIMIPESQDNSSLTMSLPVTGWLMT
jgi:hypothetical protein